MLFFSREIRIRLGLIKSLLFVPIDKKKNLRQNIIAALKYNKDFPPFIIEGIVEKYFHRNVPAMYAGQISELSRQAKCPTYVSMLHVGFGMAVSAQYLKQFKKERDPNKCKKIVVDFFKLCEKSAAKGSTGCMIEPLGLIGRLFFSTQILDEWINTTTKLPFEEEKIVNYLAWIYHGIGRGCYFKPTNLMPSFTKSVKVKALTVLLKFLKYHSCMEYQKRNLLAGFFWAVTAVSLTEPRILLDYLRHLYRLYPECALYYKDSIFAGIQTNLVMLQITEHELYGQRLPKCCIKKDFYSFVPQYSKDLKIWDEFVLDDTIREYYIAEQKLRRDLQDVFKV